MKGSFSILIIGFDFKCPFCQADVKSGHRHKCNPDDSTQPTNSLGEAAAKVLRQEGN